MGEHPAYVTGLVPVIPAVVVFATMSLFTRMFGRSEAVGATSASFCSDLFIGLEGIR